MREFHQTLSRAKRLTLSLFLALVWYGLLLALNWILKPEAGIAMRVLLFPHDAMIWLVEALSGMWIPFQQWLYAPPQMRRSAVAALLGYLLFWWAVFYAVLPLAIPRFRREAERG